MKTIEWCQMTKGKKDEVPPIDIQEFVPFYKEMNKGNLEKLYVALQEKETVLISQASVESKGTLRVE